MAKKIEIVALETGARAVAELYETEAPNTCALMWKCLETPMLTQGIQAMWVGRELMFLMPPENQKGDATSLTFEHLTQYPLPGDMVFKYFPAYSTIQFHDDFRDKPVWDFYILYGRDAILGAPAPVWAHVIEGLDDLAREAAKIREEGTKPYRVSRLSE